MTYNLTNLTTGEGFGDLVIFSNEVTGGIFAEVFLIALFMILLVGMKSQGFDRSLLSASWTLFLLSSIMVYGKFVSFLFPLAFLVTASFTTLYIYSNREI